MVGSISLQAPGASNVLGQSYLVALSADARSLAALYTAPEGAAGNAVAVSAQGTVAALGLPNSLLIARTAAGPSVLGVTALASYHVLQAVAPRELISMYGIGIGPESPQSAMITHGAIGNSLGGVQVLFDGIPRRYYPRDPRRSMSSYPIPWMAIGAQRSRS